MLISADTTPTPTPAELPAWVVDMLALLMAMEAVYLLPSALRSIAAVSEQASTFACLAAVLASNDALLADAHVARLVGTFMTDAVRTFATLCNNSLMSIRAVSTLARRRARHVAPWRVLP